MAAKTTRNGKLKCGICYDYVDRDDYRTHVVKCERLDQEDEPQPALKAPQKPKLTNSTRKITKKCPVCSDMFDEDEFDDHVDNCDRKPLPKRTPQKKTTKKCPVCSKLFDEDEFDDHVDNCDKKPLPKRTPQKKSTKKCPVCSETFDEDEFDDHVDNCDRKPSSKRTPQKKTTKKCPVCSKLFDEDEFDDHVDNCEKKPTPKRTPQKKSTKKCPVCSETFDEDEFDDHVDNCDIKPLPKRTLQKKTTKKCPVCSKSFDEDEFDDHVDYCDRKPPPKRTPQKKTTKKCPVCSDMFDEDEFDDHVDYCDRKPPRKRAIQKKISKKCPICSDMFDEDEFDDHVDHCDRAPPRQSMARKKITKKCPTCSRTVDEDDFEDHMDHCDRGPSRTAKFQKKITKRCPMCARTVDEDDFEDHMDHCDRKPSQRSRPENNIEKCPVCFNEIAKADYEKHVNACYDNMSQSQKTTMSNRKTQKSCFTCSSPMDGSKSSGYTIPCRNNHAYCIKCLQRSMNEFIQSNTAPVCHSTLCDYELSLYEVECLPIEADMIKQLLTLVKTTQRPQCPFCSFYVDFKTMTDLQRHAGSCDPENMVECEYCHCLCNKNRLADHSQQCRTNQRSEQQQALIDFLLPRTKYPVTPQQLRIFLEHRRKNHLALDPRSLVDALAEFGSTFPLEVPTRDCDICANSYIYDDIFVIGCEESHKLCYECLADSCKAKINSKETLTCPMCPYQLHDGEIKQLRIPAEEKRQFLDYQTQRTFTIYKSGTQGVIMCPNKECKWLAEAQNPNDRFQVECPLCGYQFCSLCNQQYHFRTTCQQIPVITQRWFFWCNTERGTYWQARAQQDATFRAQFEDYERQRAANTQRNQELQQRYNDLLADENYKSQNCRLCPHCGRVVQHLGGCDAMICGQNYHGGDVQSGCGKGFNWSQCTRYAPIGNTGPQQVNTNMPAPEQQRLVVHEGVRCDACQNDVQGIRFDCVHCASLIYCEKCEQRATLEHSNQIRDENKQQHVFQIITSAANGND